MTLSTVAPGVLSAGRHLMTSLSVGPLNMPLLIAGATMAAVFGAAFGVTRAVRRSDREGRRERADLLMQALKALARGERTAASAVTLCDATDADLFWRTVERYDAAAETRARFAIGRPLGASSHVEAERERLFDDDPARAERAAMRLAWLPHPDGRRALRRALARAPESVAAAAARALGRYRDRAALRWILDRPLRLRRRSVPVWTSLLRAYGRRGLPVIAAALQRGIDDSRLTRAAYEALGFGGRRECSAIIAEGLHHADPEVRVAAARALGRLRAADQAAALLEALNDKVWQVRALSAWALGCARVPAALGPLGAGLVDRSWWVRRHSAYALARLGPPGLEQLRVAAAESKDRYAREMAQEALDVAARHRKR